MSTSRAVNAQSFVNYIVSLSTYFTGNSLSSDHQTILKNYLLEGISNPSQLLNVKTAAAIANKFRTKVGLSSVTNSYGKDALSENTAKQIVSTYLSGSALTQFVDYHYYDEANWTMGINGSKKFIRIAASTDPTIYLDGKLIGGGGGGSGAIAGDGDKNASYTVVSGAGGAGGATFLETSNPTNSLQGLGGEGGSGISKKAGGNPSFALEGDSGVEGVEANFSLVGISLNYNGIIKICIGAGGGGGAGCAASAGGTIGSKTYTGGSGGNGSSFDPFTSRTIPGGAGGSAVTAANEWHGDDGVFAGGGSGGGGLGQNGSYWLYDDAGRCGTVTSGTASTAFYAGKAAAMSSTAAPAIPSSPGAGGAGGTAGITTDVNCQANGGSGGNAGCCIIYGSYSDEGQTQKYNALFYMISQ